MSKTSLRYSVAGVTIGPNDPLSDSVGGGLGSDDGTLIGETGGLEEVGEMIRRWLS